MDLERYGASERFQTESTLYPDLILARVVSQYKDLYKIVTEREECLAEVSGRFRHEASCIADFPAVGDFVMVDREHDVSDHAIIHKVLARKSAFERSAAGNINQVQIVAANIDVVFICMSLNNDYNLSRLERYLSVAWDSHAMPVVVLTKSDLCADIPGVMRDVSEIAIGVDIFAVSNKSPHSYEFVQKYLKPGVTASFIGSSGVGKSTLINLLAGEELFKTSEIRPDDKGRHTTTRRELVLLRQGGIVIDTPGMRELGVESADLSKSFSDIGGLAKQCRFGDCTHTNEPGCAVQEAIQSGRLDVRRLENYRKLKKEAKYDGLSSREIETEKINSMFGSMNEMKRMQRFVKQKNNR